MKFKENYLEICLDILYKFLNKKKYLLRMLGIDMGADISWARSNIEEEKNFKTLTPETIFLVVSDPSMNELWAT